MLAEAGPCSKCGGDLAFRRVGGKWLITCLECGCETKVRNPRVGSWLDARAIEEIGWWDGDSDNSRTDR